MRRAGRVDRNQREIVHALRAAGATVQSLASVGKGVPDILIGLEGVNLLAEIKDGAKSKSRRKLTWDELSFHRTWKGQVAIIESIEDALDLVKKLGRTS